MQVLLTLKKGIYINIQGWTLYLNWTDKKAQMNCITVQCLGLQYTVLVYFQLVTR